MLHQELDDFRGNSGHQRIEDLESDETPVSAMSFRDSWSERRGPLIEGFFSNREYDPDTEALNEAFNQLASRIGRLRPLSLEEAFKRIPRKTNSGAPLFTSNVESLPSTLVEAEAILRGSTDGRYPYILSTRTQQSKGWDSKGKTRNIWMGPKGIVVVSKMFTDPKVSRLSNTAVNAAWKGPSYVDEVMTHVLTLPGEKLSSDISRYDEDVNIDLIMRMAEMDIAIFGEQYRELIESSANHLAMDGIITPDGVYLGREGGIASGHGKTSDYGTNIQEVAWNYVSIRLNNPLSHLSVMGDDGVVVFSKGMPPLDDISGVLAEIGFTANAEKQFVAEDAIHYLQNIHLQGYLVDGKNVGVRSIHRMLNRASSLERKHQFPSKIASGMMSIRAMMQYNTARHHPNFREAVKHLVHGDKSLQDHDPLEILQSVGTNNAESALRQHSFNSEVQFARDLPDMPIVSVIRDVKLERTVF
jgi:hypothetical protein